MTIDARHYDDRPNDERHWRAGDSCPLRVLVVDDEPEVSVSAQLAARGATLDGRPIQFDTATTLNEARDLLSKNAYALAIVDWVLRAPDTGSELLRWIRDDLRDSTVRTMIHTGEPIHIAELRVGVEHDIADYRVKGLRASQIASFVRGQCRSYRDIVARAAAAAAYQALWRAWRLAPEHRLARVFRLVCAASVEPIVEQGCEVDAAASSGGLFKRADGILVVPPPPSTASPLFVRIEGGTLEPPQHSAVRAVVLRAAFDSDAE